MASFGTCVSSEFLPQDREKEQYLRDESLLDEHIGREESLG